MSHLLASLAVALALVMLLSLYRVVRGPSIFDRLTGLGLIGSKMIILLVVLGAWSERVDLYVDIALSYGLISFVGTLVLAKYFETTGGERRGWCHARAGFRVHSVRCDRDSAAPRLLLPAARNGEM